MRLLLATVILAAFLVPCSTRADDAQTVLAKNKAFAGWVFGDPSMNGLRLTGTSGTEALTDLRRGAVWRRIVTNENTKLSYGYGFTGQRFWFSNENGFVVPLLGDAIKYRVAYAVVMNQGIPGLSGTLRGTASVGGAQTQIVRVEPPSGFPIDAYIDSSGKLVRAVIDPDGSAVPIEILGYADLDGKKIISKWKIGALTSEFTKLEHANVADAEFHPPAPSASWTFGPPVELPISVTNDRIFINASINGVAGRFALDSGDGAISLNSDFADRAKVKSIAPAASYGVNGVVHTSLGRADTIQIGPHVLHDVVVLTGINVHGTRQDFDGLLGFDFLAGAIVDVDQAKQRMTIYDPRSHAVTASGPVVLADLTSGTPTVPATFDGRVKAHLTFDTGDPMAVLASDKLYGPGKVTLRIEGYANLSGVGGTSAESSPCGHSQSIELGAIKYEHIPICFVKGDALFGNDRGIIGLDFIKHFNLTFDYPNSRLYLSPNGK
ncbi:MAG: retropepsin-like domain-containing protein [Candidatus Eremiobacteraeota bacterium]|nr:retropepsin-like domain-containing protein [Candidatus Eremiobacteraeota bacterium]